MERIPNETLRVVAGGIWYGEKVTPTGERWATNVDHAGTAMENFLTPYVGKNAAGLSSLAMMYVAEGPARWGGRAVDALKGALK